MMALLPEDHAQRLELNDEVHARPPEPLAAPSRVSYVALVGDWSERDRQWQDLCDIVGRFGGELPPPGVNHFSADLGRFRLTWERHTEFVRYTFIVGGAGSDPFGEPAIRFVPADWCERLTGRVLLAAHVALVQGADGLSDEEDITQRLFSGNPLVGSRIGGGAATALTDFRIHPDRFSRILVQDWQMTPRQAGRMIQRLLEIDTYRVLALLALPVARSLTPFLTASERELVTVTAELTASGTRDEGALLERLTRLEAEIGTRAADNQYRFAAARAYYELVQRRIDELREERIQGLQTFREFTERRLAPAVNTCRAVSERQESLSRRVARTTQLLSTRVDLIRERQNQAVLESMNRRARLQLRLQQTVEGLSVAAVTYYVVGLAVYASKGFAAAGVAVNGDIVAAVCVPVVALGVALGARRMRRALTRGED